MKLRAGEWIWDETSQQPAQIISVDTIWGTDNIRAWIPATNTVVVLNHNDISPIQQNPIKTKEDISYYLSAAKTINYLNTGNPVSPLQAEIIPLPHQLYAHQRAFTTNNTRYLLADEVGLGKTIEAGLILSELKNQGLVKRSLIIAPRGLTKQWLDELQVRFNETFQLIIPDSNIELQEINIWKQSDQIVCSLDSVKPIRSRSGWSEEKVQQYNQKRFRDLVEANWDLIVVDEAHKLAGATTGVARHRLGEALSEAAPYILLLSATPHQGKTEQFKRLMSLIDHETFDKTDRINKEMVQPYVIRSEKRTAIDPEGAPLFTPRITQLIPIKWENKHREQRQLYEEVTEYIRYGYNKAIEEKRSYIGFLMVLMQRLVSSSTRAISRALERRLQVLENGPSLYEASEKIQDIWTESTGQQRLDELLIRLGEGLRDEKREVEKLASLARRCELINPDARAEALVDLIYNLRTEEKNPNLKILVFTEFLPTQEMLTEFLELRGFNVVNINGSMDLISRIEAQNRFSEDADILISTEAGGEGINLQFCHVVINYDLPWNPMRLEQRIGRIDRIGQKYPVKVFNFVFDNTVEHRVREVLEEKLAIILEEFGVDKLGDVLDIEEGEADFDRIYRNAILNPEKIEEEIDSYFVNLRERFESNRYENELIHQKKTFDLSLAKEVTNHPLPYWIEQMTLNYIQGNGGEIIKKGLIYCLKWPDGTTIDNIRFQRQELQKGQLITLNNPQLKKILTQFTPFILGMPIPSISIEQLSSKVSGFWSLWEVAVKSEIAESKRIIPIFISDEGKVLKPTSNQLWDLLIQEKTQVKFIQQIDPGIEEVYNKIKHEALSSGEEILDELMRQYQNKIEKFRYKHETIYKLKNKSLDRIKEAKRRILEKEELNKQNETWLTSFKEKSKPHYDLIPLLIMHVRGYE